MKVLVTGAGGFIGRPTTEALLQAGHEVYAIVRAAATDRASERRRNGLRVLRADLNRPKEIDRALDVVRPEGVVHLAWYTDARYYLHDSWENLASLEQTLALLRRIREAGCPRVVLAGSCLEHAEGTFAASSSYAVAKRAAHEVAATLADAGLHFSCAHIFWVYGPHEDPRRGIPSVVRALLEGRATDVTEGSQLREYLHVADVAAALRAVLESDLVGRVDIATGHPVPLRKVFEAIEAATGTADLLRWGSRPSGPDDLFEVESDPAVLRSLGTWKPQFSLDSGIRDTVRWWRRQQKSETQPTLITDDKERTEL